MPSMYCMTFVFITSNIILSLLDAAPTKATYDALLSFSKNKCPYLMETKLLNPKPSYLDFCPEFPKLQSIKSLTRESAYDVSCLLYVNNFITLCNSTVDFKTIVTNDTIDTALKLYNLTSACNILQKTKLLQEFKNGENVVSLLKKPNVCSKLCSEITSEEVTPICSLAAHSLSLVSNIPKTDENSKSNIAQTTKTHAGSSTADLQKTPIEKPKQTLEQPVKASITKPLKVENSDHLAKEENVQENVREQSSNNKATPLNVQHTDENLKTPQQTQTQSDSNRQQTSATHADSQSKQTESIQPGNEEEAQSDVQSTKLDDQKTVTATENKPTDADNQDHSEISNPEQTDKEPKVKGDDHENTQEKKPEAVEQKPPKSDTNEEEKKAPQVVPKVKDNLDKENPVQDIQNVDDVDFEGVNNINPSEDINSPPNDDDIINKVEPLLQDTKKAEKVKQTNTKPSETDEDVVNFNNSNTDEEDSFFFIYFMMVCAVFILGYIGYHNKQKVLALVIEGRRGRRGSRRGRPNSANYHKLDSNLEEAVTSSCNKNTTNIIY